MSKRQEIQDAAGSLARCMMEEIDTHLQCMKDASTSDMDRISSPYYYVETGYYVNMMKGLAKSVKYLGIMQEIEKEYSL